MIKLIGCLVQGWSAGLGLVRLDMDSFRAENDRNNKKYNKKLGFIPGQTLIAIK